MRISVIIIETYLSDVIQLFDPCCFPSHTGAVVHTPGVVPLCRDIWVSVGLSEDGWWEGRRGRAADLQEHGQQDGREFSSHQIVNAFILMLSHSEITVLFKYFWLKHKLWACFRLLTLLPWFVMVFSGLLPQVFSCRYCRPKPREAPLARPSMPSTASTPCSPTETHTSPKSSRSVSPISLVLYLFYTSKEKEVVNWCKMMGISRFDTLFKAFMLVVLSVMLDFFHFMQRNRFDG